MRVQLGHCSSSCINIRFYDCRTTNRQSRRLQLEPTFTQFPWFTWRSALGFYCAHPASQENDYKYARYKYMPMYKYMPIYKVWEHTIYRVRVFVYGNTMDVLSHTRTHPTRHVNANCCQMATMAHIRSHCTTSTSPCFPTTGSVLKFSNQQFNSSGHGRKQCN